MCFLEIYTLFTYTHMHKQNYLRLAMFRKSIVISSDLSVCLTATSNKVGCVAFRGANPLALLPVAGATEQGGG